jgi:hypothetical protein
MTKTIKPFFCSYCDKQVPCGCDKKFHFNSPDWEKEFAEIVVPLSQFMATQEYFDYVERVKSFIRQLLIKQRKPSLTYDYIVITPKQLEDRIAKEKEKWIGEIEKELKKEPNLEIATGMARALNIISPLKKN